jgi:hypothetical protein
MNSTSSFKLSLLMAGLLALPLAQAGGMSRADHSAAKSRIGAEYKADREACAAQTANAKDICQKEASAKQKVALAELQYDYSAKMADKTKVLVAKAESAYSVAKEKCDDQAGNLKDVCVKEAKAVEVKALADAKMAEKMTDARTDANDAKRDAEYKVANEKCDSLTGDAKGQCVSSAKIAFGKN